MESFLKETGWINPCESEVQEALSHLELNYPYGYNNKVSGFYDKWDNYDADCSKLQYGAPRKIAKEAAAIATEEDKKKWSILDLGAGTGLIGEELRKQGFKGHITALDFSEKMIERIRSLDNTYNSAVQHIIVPGEPLPFEKGSFDLVCGSAFGPEEIPSEAIVEVFPLMRSGSYFVNSLRISKATVEFREKMLGFVNDEIEKKGIVEVSCKEYELYKWKVKDDSKDYQIIPANIWVYQKL